MSRFLYKLSLIVLTFLVASCTKKAAVPEGNVVGFVKLINESGDAVNDKSGVLVSVEGIGVTTETGFSGRFSLNNIPAGTYDLIFEKERFGTKKYYSLIITPGKLPVFIEDPIVVYQLPTYRLSNTKIVFEGSLAIFKSNVTPTKHYNVVIFMAHRQDLSADDYEFSIRFPYCCAGENLTSFSRSFQKDQLPFEVGEKAYLICYAVNPKEESFYDRERGQEGFSSLTKVSDEVLVDIE